MRAPAAVRVWTFRLLHIARYLPYACRPRRSLYLDCGQHVGRVVLWPAAGLAFWSTDLLRNLLARIHSTSGYRQPFPLTQ